MSSNQNNLRPPKWIDRFLEWYLPDHLLEDVQGDLQEVFYKQANEIGAEKAKRAYVVTAIQYIRPYFFKRRTRHSSHLKPQYIDMIWNNFIIAFRNFRKNKVHASINTLGMAIAVTSILLIFLYVQHELTYDQFHNKINRIVVIGEQSKATDEPYTRSVYPALPELLKTYPAIENGSRVFDNQWSWISAGDKDFEEQITFVDTGFFEVFSFPLLKGDGPIALTDLSSVILSKEMAHKLFGEADPMGQTVRFDNGKQLVVRGILAPVPANSSIEPKVIVPIAILPDFAPWIKEAGDWYNSFTMAFLLLNPATNARQLEAQLPDFVTKYFAEAARGRILRLLPFEGFHKKQSDNSTYVYGLTCVAIFLLLVACINFTNLSIATSLSRIREVAIRKVIGSTRRGIIFGFITEACLISILALGIGILLTHILLPVLNGLLDMRLQVDIWGNPLLIIFLLSLSIGIGLLAGIYPALFFSALKPVNALKGKTASGPGNVRVRDGLVVIQFVIAVFLVTGTLLVFDQIQFMKSADLRFDRENVLVADLNLGYKDAKAATSQINFILNELASNPQIAHYSTSQNIPGRYWQNYNSFLPPGWTKEPVSLRQATVDAGYLPTYGIKLLEGRNFSASITSDTLQSVIINRAAMQAFGWKTAVGKIIRTNGSNKDWQIVGVIDDFHYQSLQGTVEPLIHFFSGPAQITGNNFLSIKVKPQDAASLLSYLRKEWKQIPSRKEFSHYFVDEEFNKQYERVERSLSLITFFTIVTILIACAGVFALTSLSTHLRSKEVGVRKVLGANIISIVSLFFKDFVKLVLLANLIAWPLVYYAIQLWLQNFAYPTSISVWIFGVSSVVTILIALLTISFQTIKAALANPVKALRNE
ncbi:FtsX-like permease family protein [Rhodocytophaga rosea]|uniref:FtsX-like permease family protein n=1 Tax=Rhodocytophaga rosea TaxID=2704465 RepID=A0A6C0GGV6_9BACT|nr:ABC transporter permease [Rhodocytophaga rosea]QHT67228.1 FtsX-like permease family protein [Rhodocytophaga rosea]